MAERRMFTKKIIDSDAFLDMPLSTQSLYFHLNMRADDDGFLNNPKKIQRMIGASEDDLKLLIAKRFVLTFENGVIVIKHWRMHNWIRKDRYSQTQYVEQLATLAVKDDGSYTEKPLEMPVATTCQPDGTHMAYQPQPQVRLGKVSIVQDNMDIIEDGSDEPPKPKTKKFTPPTVEEVTTYCTERGNTVDPERFVDFYAAKGWMLGKNKMKDWKAAVRTWERTSKSEGVNTNGQAASNSGPARKFGNYI